MSRRPNRKFNKRAEPGFGQALPDGHGEPVTAETPEFKRETLDKIRRAMVDWAGTPTKLMDEPNHARLSARPKDMEEELEDGDDEAGA